MKISTCGALRCANDTLRQVYCFLAACRRILVPQAPPGNAHGEALPPAKTSGRAAEMPLPVRTWERVSEEFCLLRQAARNLLKKVAHRVLITIRERCRRLRRIWGHC
jgi:hypothetical protein